ncbi:hypothetical protein [Methylocystis bryophila]|uniref:Uncharacterized protein n=1 Tax=Methylocystis bryophila TaxID=655015 RepID=A0A1W6MR33_9HYPH|nr:hypothetical protein [Methylocystis bryophila]ARN80035.1 hypothetical protein B1812_01885 [Methylocystis bryophila]BDV39949.1 hypothetical protein DSM21852_32020 [Methylocystis bryophila]
MTQPFSLEPFAHGFLGPLIALRLPGQPRRRLTLQEATILSRALDAVAKGASAERLIYMSPVASDCDFEARVVSSCLVVVMEGFADARLSFEEAMQLAQALKEAADAWLQGVTAEKEGGDEWPT